MLTLQLNERLIKEDKAMLVVGRLRTKSGILYLTNQRVVFMQYHWFSQLFGLISLLFQTHLPGKSTSWQRTAITTFAPGKFGMSKNVLEIHVGVQSWKFVLTDTLQAWQSAIQRIA